MGLRPKGVGSKTGFIWLGFYDMLWYWGRAV